MPRTSHAHTSATVPPTITTAPVLFILLGRSEQTLLFFPDLALPIQTSSLLDISLSRQLPCPIDLLRALFQHPSKQPVPNRL